MHTVTIDYTWLGESRRNELRASTYSIKDIHYAEHVTIDTYVEEKRKDEFRAWMIELTNGKSAISEGEHVYVEFDVAQ